MTRWSYRIGTAFGIPVNIHVSLILFLGLMALTGAGLHGLLLMVAVFASVLVHELGHSLVARRLGLPIADISLYPFGGMARMLAPPKTSGDEIRVAVAGPLVSLALGLVFLGLFWLRPFPGIAELAEVNLLLGIFNLLPALPMDGGRIFRAVLSRRMGFYRATAVSARLARWLALGLLILGVVYSGWLIVLAAFLLFMGLAEEGAARARMYMGDPGYQDAPASARPLNPFVGFAERAGFRVPGSDWEVLSSRGSSAGDGQTRVYTDERGNRIVVQWWTNR